jgi:hypothetical protein
MKRMRRGYPCEIKRVEIGAISLWVITGLWVVDFCVTSKSMDVSSENLFVVEYILSRGVWYPGRYNDAK